LNPILLTGSSGQVGAELVTALAPLGRVIACDRSALDLADPDAIVAKMREVRPAAVVNAAAYTAVDRAESEPALAMAVNGTAPGILAEEAARLNALLNRPAGTQVSAPVLPVFPAALPPRDSLEGLALANRPMLRAGEQEVKAADAAARLARREIWPDLQLGVQYGQRPMDGSTDRMVSFMLGFTLPVFAGSRQLKMREETQAMKLMATADLEAMRAETRGRLGELYADVQRARNLTALYRTTIIPQAEATVASALATYRVGGVDFMTLLDDQMTVNRYRQDLFQLEAEQGKALAELEMLIGGELLDPDIGVEPMLPGGGQ